MFDKAFELFAEGKYMAFAVATVMGLLFNAKNILAFADIYKKRRIEILKEAIGLESINVNLKKHFEDEIEGEYFRLAHKVKLDKGIRDACIDWYYRLNRTISFSHFIRAKTHLDVQDGNLSVTISNFDKVGYWYNLIAGVGMLIFGFLLAAMINTIKTPTLIGVFTLLGISVFSISFGSYMLSQTLSVISARKVQQAIEQ